MTRLAPNISSLHYDPAAKHSRSQGEGVNPIARRGAGETIPAPRLLLFAASRGHYAIPTALHTSGDTTAICQEAIPVSIKTSVSVKILIAIYIENLMNQVKM